jgi:hypothetical protein
MEADESQELEPDTHWVNPATLEKVEAGTPGAIKMHFKIPDPPNDFEKDLGDWLTRKLVENDAAMSALLEQHGSRVKQILAERRALERHFPRMEAITAQALEGSKRKSVKYDFGTFKFVSSTKTVVDDDFAALLWAEEHCPEAIKRTAPSLLKSKLPVKTETVPGVRQVKSTAFSFAKAK